MASAGSAFVYAMFFFFKALILGDAVQGFPTLIVTMLFLGGLQLLCRGRLGEYVARIFDEQQVNIIEVSHQRVFTTLPAKGLITDIECETRDRAHLDQLTAALAAAGYEVSPVELA